MHLIHVVFGCKEKAVSLSSRLPEPVTSEDRCNGELQRKQAFTRSAVTIEKVTVPAGIISGICHSRCGTGLPANELAAIIGRSSCHRLTFSNPTKPHNLCKILHI